ncbi:MAG TPA: FAD-binding protein, partial [Candidatus Sulfotelmatobacter sp.]
CGIELHPAGGSSAGLLTDVHARVIHQRRRPILGLYASGNAAAATEQGGYRERYAGPIWRPWERWRSGR